MCAFEEWPIISRYSRQQAIDDGVIVEMFKRHAGILPKKIVVTSAVHSELTEQEIKEILKEYMHWVKFDKPCLPEEDHLFYTGMQGKTVWVMEDDEAITVMYPSDY